MPISIKFQGQRARVKGQKSAKGRTRPPARKLKFKDKIKSNIRNCSLYSNIFIF